MMREIKFKAWDKIGKRIGEVNYIKYSDVQYNQVSARFKQNGKTVDEWFAYGDKDGCDNIILMQYTGLKDRNGKEIYEGDILQLFYGKENTPLTTTKVFFNKEGYWDSKNLSEQHPFRACYGGFSKCEVIGNIYENPELLEGERNASN